MNTFYDIHTHAFDLSHPNLSVFLQREDIIDSIVDSVWTLSLRWLLPFASLMPINSLKKLIHKKAATFQNQLANTLAFFDILIEYQFLVMDYFLRNSSQAAEHTDYKQARAEQRIYSPSFPLFQWPHSSPYQINSNQPPDYKPTPAPDNPYPKIVLCPIVIDFGHKKHCGKRILQPDAQNACSRSGKRFALRHTHLLPFRRRNRKQPDAPQSD